MGQREAWGGLDAVLAIGRLPVLNSRVSRVSSH